MMTLVNLSPVSTESRCVTLPPTALAGNGYDAGPAAVTINTRGVQDLTIECTVGGTGALTGLETTFQAVAGGTPVPALLDGDHATASSLVPEVFDLNGLNGNPTPTNIPAGKSFAITYHLAGRHPEMSFRPAGPSTATVEYEISRNA